MIETLAFNIFIDLSLIALPLSLLVSRKRSLKKALQSLGFKPVNWLPLLKKTAKLFLALVAVSIWLSLILNFLNLNDLELVSESLEAAKAAFPLFFWVVVVRVVSEEVFFRGFLTNELGAVASSAIFALLHAGYGSVAEIIGAFVLGLVLAKAFQLNKNLYPNILAHAAYNAMAMLALG